MHFHSRQRYNEEVCGIRSDFQYQNQIYVLAGEILSYLSGKPVEETVSAFFCLAKIFILEKIFEGNTITNKFYRLKIS